MFLKKYQTVLYVLLLTLSQFTHANDVTNFTIAGNNYKASDSNVIVAIPYFVTFFEGSSEFFQYSAKSQEIAFSVEYDVPGVVSFDLGYQSSIHSKLDIYDIDSGKKVAELGRENSCSDKYICGEVYLEAGKYAFLLKSSAQVTYRYPLQINFYPQYDALQESCQPLTQYKENCLNNWNKAAWYSGETEYFYRFRYETLANINTPEGLDNLTSSFYYADMAIDAGKFAYNIGKLASNIGKFKLSKGDLAKANSLIDKIGDDASSLLVDELNNGLKQLAYKNNNLAANIKSEILDTALSVSTLLTQPNSFQSWLGAVQTLSGDIVTIADLTKKTLSLNEIQLRWNNYWVARRAAYMFVVECGSSDSCFNNKLSHGRADMESSLQTIFDTENNFHWLYPDRFEASQSKAVFDEIIIRLQDFRDKHQFLYLMYLDVDGDGVRNDLDEDPNDPALPAPPRLPGQPIADFSLSLAELKIGNSFTATSTAIDPESIDVSHHWLLIPPANSSIELDSSQMVADSISIAPDVPGEYQLKLVATNETGTSAKVRSISVTKDYPNVEVVYYNDKTKIYIEDIDIGGGDCQLIYLPSVTVPEGQKWTKIKFAASKGDVVLLVDDDEVPSTKGSFGCPNYTQTFDADKAYDWAGGTAFFDWDKDLYPGDVLRFAVFSYEGRVSNYGINSEVSVSTDMDGDGIPDENEDPACLNNPNASYDSDQDNICDDLDVFDRTIEMVEALKIDLPRYSILTPFPGTPLYGQLAKEKRITDDHWAMYDVQHVVFQPKKMTSSELMQGFTRAWRQTYSTKGIIKRIGRPHLLFPLSVMTNQAYHHYADKLESFTRERMIDNSDIV